MTGVLSNSRRSVMSLAWAAGLLAVSVAASNAQGSFNSFNSNHVELISGFTFKINNVSQTDLSNVGVSGTYEFGFATPGVPIMAKILAGSAFGAVGSIVSLTSMKDFGIIGPGSSGLTFLHPGNSLHEYNGTTDSATWSFNALSGGPGGSAGGVYTAGSFGSSAHILRGGIENTSTSDDQYGDFDFTNISHTGPIYFGAHFRANGLGGVTAPLIVDVIDAPPNLVPEGSSMAMLGCGALPLLGILIKRRRSR